MSATQLHEKTIEELIKYIANFSHGETQRTVANCILAARYNEAIVNKTKHLVWATWGLALCVNIDETPALC